MLNSIPYGRQHITDDDIAAVTAVLRSPYLTQGPKIGELEQAFASYIGSKYAVAVANGTAALHLCCMALGRSADAVGPGTRVITTPITFSASANCVRYCGGEVHFADVDPDTVLLDPKAVRALLERHPKGHFSGVIPVDFAGYPVDMIQFRELADEFGLWIIEDACHAPGASFMDKTGTETSDRRHRCGDGSLAELAIFSFHPVKHIAAGEGGMITTNNEDFYKHLLRLRTHGITNKPDEFTMPYAGEPERGGWYMELQELGYNYRLTDIQAALALSQLNRVDAMLSRRRELAARYDSAFREAAASGLPVKIIVPPPGVVHAYHLYVIQTPDRKGLYDFLRTKQILAQVHYVPVHLMPYYRQLGSKPGDFPNAERYYAHGLSLPLFPTLTNDEQDYVIENVTAFLKPV